MKGLFPILATPFDGADRTDVENLRREVDFVIENGVHGARDRVRE
jgi:dihydrodipicolinate synthase/N-acetylneuraminate lyase